MQPAAWSLQDWLAAACGEIVKVWHPHDAKQEVKIYEGTNVYAADFSSNNKVLAVAGDKGQITLYSSKTHDTGSRAVGHFPNPLEVGVESFSCVRFAANDSSLVAGCHNGTVHTWALKGNAAVHKIPVNGVPTSVAVSSDTEVIAFTSSTGQVQLHDFKTAAKIKTLLSGPGPATNHACFSSQAPLFVCGDATGSVCLWGSDAFERLRELPLHKAGVTGLALSMTTADLVFSCGSDGVMKCWDLRARKEAWSVMSRQPYTALSVKHDSQLVAVGNAAGCVAIHDVRNFRVPSSLQQFSNTSAPVSVVRWQHLHVSRGSRAPSSTVSAATSTVSATGQSSNPLAAAWRQQQQQQQQQHSASQSQRPSISVPAAVALVNAQSAGVGSVHLQPPAPGTVKGNVTGTLEPDTPSTSISASMEFGMRAFSPVQMGGDESTSDDAATSALSREVQLPPAAVATSILDAHEAATPVDSLQSMGPGGAFMITPGIGMGYAPDDFTSIAFTSMLDAAPISKLTGVPASVGLEPPVAALRQVPPAITAAAAKQVNSSTLTNSSKPSTAPVATSQPPPAGRAVASASAAAAATSSAAVDAEAPAAAASGGGATAGTRSQRTSSTASGSASASMSRPNSRPGSAAGSTSTAAGGLGGRRPSGRGLLDATETTTNTAGGRSGGGGGGVSSAAGGVKAAGGLSSRPSSAAMTSAAAAAPSPAEAVSGLREDVFKEYIDQQMAELRDDVRNMHLDMLRQFHQAQMDLVSVVEGLAQRQDQLADAVGELTSAVQGMRAAKQLPGAGAVGLMPWL